MINESEIGKAASLCADRRILGAIVEQLDVEGIIVLSAFGFEGGDQLSLAISEDEVPGIRALINAIDNKLHDELLGAGVQVDLPLYEPDEPDEPATLDDDGTEAA